MEKTSGKGAEEKGRKISAEMVYYAGLGALFERRPEEFQMLVAKGKKERAQVGSGYAVYEMVRKRWKDVPSFLRAERSEVFERALLDHVSGGVLEVLERELADPPSRMKDIIESMVPQSVPTAPAVLQARRNSAARTALIEEFGLLTSTEVAELSQSQAGNRAALASRWKREGKIFSVRHLAKDYFPGFQFEANGQPREAIAAALEALGGARGWETALWFTGANGYLEGLRPVDLLESEPDAVVEAAKHEGDETYF